MHFAGLTMADKVNEPKPEPMATNRIDRKDSKEMANLLHTHGVNIPSFPFRQATATPSTTVYTNHFQMKIDPAMKLYEYNITGLPARMSQQTQRLLVTELIDAQPFLKLNRSQIITDYNEKLISFVEIG